MNPPIYSSRFFRSTIISISIASLFLILLLVSSLATTTKAEPTPIIFDTDISSDVDDAGAVAVLHALANQSKISILAMMVSSGDPWGGSSLDALNTSFGRPNIPIGINKEKAVTHVSKYTQYIAEHYPHDFPSAEQGPNAVQIYRKVLAVQPPGSVVVISVGYLSNLSQLLTSGPDQHSPLDGRTLIAKKVKKLLCMAGEFPQGKEWNIYQDANAAIHVSSHWPTPIVFCGFEIGNRILTGQILQKIANPHPLREAYQRYNNITNRQSWDQATVLLADSTLLDSYFALSEAGYVRISEIGSNSWEAQPEGPHRFVNLTTHPKNLARVIDELMLAATGAKP